MATTSGREKLASYLLAIRIAHNRVVGISPHGPHIILHTAKRRHFVNRSKTTPNYFLQRKDLEAYGTAYSDQRLRPIGNPGITH